MQFKRAKVIMLPIKKEITNSWQLTISKGKLKCLVGGLSKDNLSYFHHLKFQELYIISDDTFVKKGEWYYDRFSKTIEQCNSISYQSNVVRKIIATTDTSLFITQWEQTNKKSKCYNVQANIENTKLVKKQLPQPSQQFIEKYIEEYNKGNIITDVLVEYEPGYVNPEWNKEKLKINPKDNTITIKKIKDSWNREEVIELIKKFNKDCAGQPWFDTDENWIEKNL